MTGFKTHVQVEVKDKTGKVIKRSRKKLCKSYVKQIMSFLFLFGKSSNQDIKDTDGTVKTVALVLSATDACIGAMEAYAEDDTYGIQVGIGITEPLIEDYKLETRIANGLGDGELSYGTTIIDAVVIVGNMAKIVISRPFTNNSGENIDVTEVGLAVKFKDGDENDIHALLERSLLSFTVADETTGTVTYILSVST